MCTSHVDRGHVHGEVAAPVFAEPRVGSRFEQRHAESVYAIAFNSEAISATRDIWCRGTQVTYVHSYYCVHFGAKERLVVAASVYLTPKRA